MILGRLAPRTIRCLLLISAIGYAAPASAAFFLDLSAVDENHIGLVLKSDTPISSIESIDIELKFDRSVLQLVGKPKFESVLDRPDFKLGDCGQRAGPGNVFRSNCGGFFDPMRAELDSGELVSWLVSMDPSVPQTTSLEVRITLGEDDPILFTRTAALPIPEPGMTALLLAGLGLLGLRTMAPARWLRLRRLTR